MNAEIFLTESCDLHCSFCGAASASDPGRDLKLSSVDSFLSDIEKLGCRYLSFSGGEPFCHPDIRKAIRLACSRGFLVNITTNGMHIDEGYADFAARRNIITRISLHTLDELRFRKMTGGELKKVLESVILMKETGARFAIGMTVSDENIDEVRQLAQFAKDSGADHIRFTPVYRVGRGSSYEMSQDTITELLRVITGTAISLKECLEWGTDEEQISAGYEELFLTGECPAGEEYIALTPDLKLRACPVLPEHADLPEGRYRAPESIERFREHYLNLINGIDAEMLEGRCGGCAFASKCRGGCPAVKISYGLPLNAGQPLCIYKMIRRVLEKFPEEDRRFLKEYWYYWCRKQYSKGRTCPRRLPVWELHFSRR